MYLTLVNSIIPRLRREYLQRPGIRALHMLRLEALIVCVGHYANSEDVQIPFPNPGHSSIPNVKHAAVEVGHLPDTCYDLSLRGVVKARLRGIWIVPEYRVLLVVDTVTDCWAEKTGNIQ